MRTSLALITMLAIKLACLPPLKAEDEVPAIPSTDITLFSIDENLRLTKVDAGNALNAFRYDGYDNQPYFSADGKQLFFTRMLEQQTDIFSYHFEHQELRNITNSEDISEYSPTVFDESSLSVIGVNEKGQQHLRLVNLEDAAQKVLNAEVEPVGYHAWLNPETAAVFVLGDVMTLQLLDVRGETKAKPLAENIGRCLQRMEDNLVSFTLFKDGLHHLYSVNHNGAIASLDIVLPEGVQDYVWWDSEGVIVGMESQLWYISSTNKKKIADLNDSGINNISRLALDSNKKKLAIVYE